MNRSVYIEPPVVSYLPCRPSRNALRRSHEVLPRKWWRTSRFSFDLYPSTFTLDEASAGDVDAAARRVRVLQQIPLLPNTAPAMALAQRLERVLKLPQRSRIDAVHVAIAAASDMAF